MPVKTPHILLAATNSRQMLSNLAGILDSNALSVIESELRSNAAALFHLGQSHLDFAKQTAIRHWRQRISRFYYGSYNARRAVMLEYNGAFNTDSSDHQKVILPDSFQNRETYLRRFVDLRSDRNLADYDHTAEETELLLGQVETERFATEFCALAAAFLTSRGVRL